jgi:erythrocyte band 7 integral membrane protein
MAKSGNSKVIFVPMQLQSDVVSQLAGSSGAGMVTEGNDSSTLGMAGNVGLLNSITNV